LHGGHHNLQKFTLYIYMLGSNGNDFTCSHEEEDEHNINGLEVMEMTSHDYTRFKKMYPLWLI